MSSHMTDPWTFSAEPPVIGGQGGVLSLVEGSSFCISAASGDIVAGSPHGLFFRDSRLLSRFELLVNGRRPETLSSRAARTVRRRSGVAGPAEPG